jgi:hypothetical protein
MAKIWAHLEFFPPQTKMSKMRRWPLHRPMHRKERSNDVRCVLFGGKHSANYKEYEVYKELQQKKYPRLRTKQYTPLTQIKHHPPTQSRETYPQITKRNHYAPSNIEQALNAQQSRQQTGDVQDL